MKLLRLLFFIGVNLSFILVAKTGFAYNDNTQTVLPLKLSAQGMPSIEINVQGKIVPLVFDTGASKDTLVLSPHALKGVQVNFTGQKNCGDTVTGRVCMKMFVIPTVKLGQLVLHNVSGTLMHQLWGNQKGFIETPASRNGIIGLKALENFGVLVDYPHSQVILTKNYRVPQGYDVSKWVQIPFEIKYGINTQGELDGIPVNLVWDTGANFSILVPNKRFSDKVVSCAHNTNCPADFPKGSDKALKTDKFVFNGQQIANNWFEVSTEPFPFDGLVASNFFKHNLVFIDFKNKTLFVKGYDKLS